MAHGTNVNTNIQERGEGDKGESRREEKVISQEAPLINVDN